jgi:predicted secreted acid phosphatase
MSYRRLPSCLVILCVLTATSLFATPPSDLAVDKQKLESYVASGRYEKDIANVTNQAQAYVLASVKANRQLRQPQKLAIVFDIDETSLSNYNDMLRLGFGGTYHEIQQANDEGHDPAIKPTLALYHTVQARGVYVFFVTGRPEADCQAAQDNMKAVGYTQWQGFYCKPKAYQQIKSAVPYKQAMRKQITDDGYTIIANIGDQQSDLEGGYAEKTFKLPNPFYHLS